MIPLRSDIPAPATAHLLDEREGDGDPHGDKARRDAVDYWQRRANERPQMYPDDEREGVK